jgi:hypothetical protein
VTKPINEGQRVRHAVFGLGTAVLSDPSYTMVDFDDHGKKRFVTSMFEVELVETPRPPRSKSRAAKR